jgi:hypothetical protein
MHGPVRDSRHLWDLYEPSRPATNEARPGDAEQNAKKCLPPPLPRPSVPLGPPNVNIRHHYVCSTPPGPRSWARGAGHKRSTDLLGPNRPVDPGWHSRKGQSHDGRSCFTGRAAAGPVRSSPPAAMAGRPRRPRACRRLWAWERAPSRPRTRRAHPAASHGEGGGLPSGRTCARAPGRMIRGRGARRGCWRARQGPWCEQCVGFTRRCMFVCFGQSDLRLVHRFTMAFLGRPLPSGGLPRVADPYQPGLAAVPKGGRCTVSGYMHGQDATGALPRSEAPVGDAGRRRRRGAARPCAAAAAHVLARRPTAFLLASSRFLGGRAWWRATETPALCCCSRATLHGPALNPGDSGTISIVIGN